jgi:hypothetical protein
LSTADDQLQVREAGYALLRKAREVTHRWTREILSRLQKAVGDDEVDALQRRACEMAATCRSTFDVEPRDLDALLCTPEDVAILIECTIVVHDNTPPHLGHAFLDFQKLLHRDKRLSHLVGSHVDTLVHTDRFGCGLDKAIKSIWSVYRPGNGWRQLSEPNSRWLTTLTAPSATQQPQKVYYNTLNGELLVDGKQLGRLPHEIVGHDIYKRTFGQV